jgi:hypothetical protein
MRGTHAALYAVAWSEKTAASVARDAVFRGAMLPMPAKWSDVQPLRWRLPVAAGLARRR